MACASCGKGAVPLRKIVKYLKKCGYEFVRYNGHYIYKNSLGDTVAIPKTCATPLIKRVFKEHNIEYIF